MRVSVVVTLATVAAVFTGSCYSEDDGSLGGRTGTGGRGGGGNGDGDGDDASVVSPASGGSAGSRAETGVVPTSIACATARTGEQLPARTIVMSAQEPERPKMLTGDLYSQFAGACGACHVSLKEGNFQVSQLNFAEQVTKDLDGEDIGSKVIDRIYDEEKWMPPAPAVTAPKTRDPQTDNVLRLGALLKAWFKQQRPKDFFYPDVDPADAPKPEQSYLLTEKVGKALTNLGNCIPDKFFFSEDGDALDAKFASATTLPQNLADTDLTTFDSAELAKSGMLSYAPAYPLWSDNARKVRHVRVPRGKSIVFDKEKQTFEIPENTRFYKTFSRKVIEKDGSERWRKIETRLIVVRKPKVVNGVTVQAALFGTYEWDLDTEKFATLSNVARRDGTPFGDNIKTFTQDEKKEEEITAAHVEGEGDLAAELQAGGARRHYAIPGSERCIQCHMGSPNESFVLGMLPLQMKWRPKGEGGVIEEAGEDELNQLQRLIDYGLITGMESPDDVVNLEDSEGDRKPRNDQELTAQGYLLGNCAHCHNSLGFPTVNNPELHDVLNFLPGKGPIEGIFQFPLERFSPRIGRGLGGVVKMPYITPSLVDYPTTADRPWTATHDTDGPNATDTAQTPAFMMLAPWRSLIYRNVDTPFPYSVDVALFPHMPMNTPGFDCRAPQLLGSWMVSIPAIRKNSVDETIVQGTLFTPNTLNYSNVGADVFEQPYKEVKPTDMGYKRAKEAAENRLRLYQTGEDPTKSALRALGTPAQPSAVQPRFFAKYAYCPDTSDIVDPTVNGSKTHLVPSDLLVKEKDGVRYAIPTNYDPVKGYPRQYTEDLKRVPSTAALVWPDDGVPDRAHWVRVESGEPPGEWLPRRQDWKDILVDDKDPASPNKTDVAQAEERLALSVIKNIKLSSAVKDFASKDFPFGLWVNKPECASKLAAAGQKPVSEFASSRMLWMDRNPDATPSAPVYMERPGAAVFNMVCQNCHGPHADARGRQADTLQAMTGGDARVANLRDGLFGPQSSPGSNRQRVYDAGKDLTANDWAARYLAWMALGGTEKLIPKGILNVVSVTPVLGQVRFFGGADSANMLGPIQYLCSSLFALPTQLDYNAQNTEPGRAFDGAIYRNAANAFPGGTEFGTFAWDTTINSLRQTGVFLPTIGDPELFSKICSLDNAPPVRVYDMTDKLEQNITYIPAAAYPKDKPVGTQRGTVEMGVSDSNLLPWCAYNETLNGRQDPYTTVDGKPLPACPQELITESTLMKVRDVQAWSFHGAANAGLMVFSYLDEIAKGKLPVPAHDHCEQLP